MTEAPGRHVLVIADDLTGANATAAGLARARLRAVTVADEDRTDTIAEFTSRFDAVVVSTNNRHTTPGESAAAARRVLAAGWPARLVSNRIDSTLRGNIGATTEALVIGLREQCEGAVVALCIPAHPDAERHTVAGVQLLRGRRLEETELAHDPRSPMHCSGVEALVAAQTDLPTRSIPLATVTGPAEGLTTALADAVADGIALVVVDAVTNDHVQRAVDSAAALRDVTWLCVDPGPATVAMARALGLGTTRPRAPYLAVSGSATGLTRRQLARLISARATRVVGVVIDDRGLPDVGATSRALREALAGADGDDVVLLASALAEDELLPQEARKRIPAALAGSTRRALETEVVDGLYLTGGDLAAACLGELDADGLDVSDEVVPLAVAGTLVGGPWSGLPVVTKGGLVGDEDTTVACIEFLERTAEATRRNVPPARSRTP